MLNDREVKKSLLIWCAVGYRLITFVAQVIFIKIFTGDWEASGKMALSISVMDFVIYLVYHYYWNAHFKTSYKKPAPHACHCGMSADTTCNCDDAHGA